ncbi:MAG: type II toxin-antitoxin system Phd/YefM family antitoxin [Woronichinia naegeliana WA131]|uniref:Antitoxin n=1 Tax=Woronichinia naegeliana WA131 TaxID=2824559 RepID=A0A977L1M8_9CYAN|nr:MAG: type II toxin-antitoxin system Phd/YefM family antitoxin [Woronichinia naegeliana WA131]
MNFITINQFTNNLKNRIKQVVTQHTPLKITNQDGADFVVISVEDWEQQQETLAILQNNTLMEQIAKSMTTHSQNQGYTPAIAELNEILSL